MQSLLNADRRAVFVVRRLPTQVPPMVLNRLEAGGEYIPAGAQVRQNVSLKPNCTVRGAYARFELYSGSPNSGLSSSVT